jgi:hypothetical protein
MADSAGEPADGHTHESACLNCGTGLAGTYCHACGQHAHVHRTLGAFWHDLLHGVLHFEGKIWRTLPMLAWHPGALTRRYIAGERAGFVSPLALFLFSVFLMFAVVNTLGGPIDLMSEDGKQDIADARRDLAVERNEALAEIARLEQQRDTARAAGRPTRDLERRIADKRRGLVLQKRAFDAAMRLANQEELAGPSVEREPSVTILSETGWRPLDQAIAKAEKNPSLLLYKLQTNAYKYSWLLIPISMPFLWLLFLHRRRYRQDYGAYDHLIFVTYSIAFMSLGAILLTVLSALGLSSAMIGTAITFLPPIHIYRQLRGAYELPRWSAAWRTFVLLVFAGVALTLFLMLLVLIGVIG